MVAFTATAPGKMILAGEHAVVYGHPAIAFPIPEIQTEVVIEPAIKKPAGSIVFDAQDIGIKTSSESLEPIHPFNQILKVFQRHYHLFQIAACTIRISSNIPIASGMGSGASMSAAFFRALAAFTGNKISDQEVSDLTFETEKIFHGNPSGIDNSVVSHQRPIFFLKNHPVETLHLKNCLTFILADTGIQSSTKVAVNGVREKWEKSKTLFNDYFDEIGNIVRKLKQNLESGNLTSIGKLMNRNHELLQKIGVSNKALDSLVFEAREEKAYGAKLIGAGLGGSIAALVNPELAEATVDKLKRSGAIWTLISTFHSRVA